MTEAPRNRHALVTRPERDATGIAAAVMRRGVMPLIAPMTTIEMLDADLDADVGRCQAILFTSGNGVRAFCRVSGRRDRHVYAVGAATAALARDNGFSPVTSADGSGTDLARLVERSLNAYDGPLLHASGTEVAGDLSEILERAGFEILRHVLYAAEAVDRLPEEAETALRENRLDHVLFFSPRTAAIFHRLVEAAGLDSALGRVAAVCLSEAVARRLRVDAWKEIRVAARPEIEAMAELVDDTATAGGTTAIPSGRPAAAAGGRERGGAPPPPEAPAGPGSEAGAAPRGSRPPGRARLRPALYAAAVAALAAALGFFASTLWPTGRAGVDDPAAAERKAEIARLTESFRGGLARLEEARRTDLAGLREVAAQIAELRNGLSEARTRLAAVDGLAERLDAGTLSASEEVGDLARRLARLESGAAQAEERSIEAGRRAAALDEAVSELRSALSGAVTRIDGLERTVRSVRESAGDGGAPPEALREELAELRSALGRAGGRIDELERDLGSARASIGDPERRSATALAVSRLRETLSRSGPFAVELAALDSLAAGDPDIASATAPLAEHAADGVPSRDLLLDRFPGVVDAVMDAAAGPDGTGDWWDRTLAELRKQVRIRRVDGKGGEVDVALSRAEAAARRGDLAGAARALSELRGRPADAAAPWLGTARARLVLENAAAELDHVVLKRLGAAAGLAPR